MAEWWEAYDVDLHRRETCWHCAVSLTGTQIFFPWGTYTIRGRSKLRAIQVCATCYAHESAMAEATDEGRKFVPIELVRCVCGRAQLSSIGECAACHRQRRMLDRQYAEIKLVRRILSSIRKEIKNDKSTLDGGTSRTPV